MELPRLKMGRIDVPLPIIQGGMAIRISTHRLAAAVANQGGIGIIAGTGMSEVELRKEIGTARQMIRGKGALGVNILFAVTGFGNLVKTAMASGIDLFISGAGFSRDMFAWGREYKVAVVPVVSSARLAKIAEGLGASAVVVEGVEAGGHLGTDRSIKEIFREVLQAVKIPVLPAGGILHGQDIYHFIKQGAQGVQMATRFAASDESNAPPEFKEEYIKARAEDSVIIQSSVGLPARGIISPFSRKILGGKAGSDEECTDCLRKCSRTFCIRRALERAQHGDMVNGLIFAGQRVGEIKDVLPVSKIFENLLAEYNEQKQKYEEIETQGECGGQVSLRSSP